MWTKLAYEQIISSNWLKTYIRKYLNQVWRHVQGKIERKILVPLKNSQIFFLLKKLKFTTVRSWLGETSRTKNKTNFGRCLQNLALGSFLHSFMDWWIGERTLHQKKEKQVMIRLKMGLLKESTDLFPNRLKIITVSPWLGWKNWFEGVCFLKIVAKRPKTFFQTSLKLSRIFALLRRLTAHFVWTGRGARGPRYDPKTCCSTSVWKL